MYCGCIFRQDFPYGSIVLVPCLDRFCIFFLNNNFDMQYSLTRRPLSPYLFILQWRPLVDFVKVKEGHFIMEFKFEGT